MLLPSTTVGQREDVSVCLYACWVTRVRAPYILLWGAGNSQRQTAHSPPPPRSTPFGPLLLAWLAALLRDDMAPPPYPSPPHPTHTKQTNSNSQHSLQPPPPSRSRSIWLFAFHLTRASQEPHFLKKTQYSSLSLSLSGQLILTVCKCTYMCVCAYVFIHWCMSPCAHACECTSVGVSYRRRGLCTLKNNWIKQ